MNKLHIGSKKKKVLIGVAIVVGVYASYTVGWNVGRGSVAVQPKPAIVTPPPDVYSLWSDTNKERVKASLSPLVLDPSLTSVATSRCNDMVNQNYWMHNNPQGKTPQDFMQAAVPKPINQYWSGENISADYSGSDVSSAITLGWMGSEGHRANILNAHFTHVGYAVCNNKDHTNIVVQDFVGE